MKTVLSVLLVSTAGFLAGCGRSGSSASSVSGSVTYKGSPVTGGTMLFHGKDKVFPASLGPDGKYVCPSVPPGEYTVTIDTKALKKAGDSEKSSLAPEKETPEIAKAREMAKGAMPVYVPIPSKYADAKTSGLTVTVGSGSNTKDLPLTD